MARLTRRKRPFYLKQWRQFRQLSQEKLADRVGMTQGMISQLEMGRARFTEETLEILADALMCEPVDLLIRDPSDPDAPWTIWDTLRPTERRQAVEILKALKRASGD